MNERMRDGDARQNLSGGAENALVTSSPWNDLEVS